MSFQLTSGDRHQTGEDFVTKKHLTRVRLLKLISLESAEVPAAIRLCVVTKIRLRLTTDQECTEVPAKSISVSLSSSVRDEKVQSEE